MSSCPRVLVTLRLIGLCRFAKYFGSGVIIATAFIHLLAPAWEELTSECLSGAWEDYVSHTFPFIRKILPADRVETALGTCHRYGCCLLHLLC